MERKSKSLIQFSLFHIEKKTESEKFSQFEKDPTLLTKVSTWCQSSFQLNFPTESKETRWKCEAMKWNDGRKIKENFNFNYRSLTRLTDDIGGGFPIEKSVDGKRKSGQEKRGEKAWKIRHKVRKILNWIVPSH